MSSLKTVLIKQSGGLGDILFIQKIAHHYAGLGHPVLWPVIDPYKNLGHYLRNFSYPSITSGFKHKEEYLRAPRHAVTEFPDCLVICTDGCASPSGTMKAKYELVRIDWRDWVSYLDIALDTSLSEKLFYNVLGLNDNSEYALFHKYLGSPPEHLHLISLPFETNLTAIPIELLEGFSLFEWMYVAQRATELYLEGSAIIYLIEKLQPQARISRLYSRDNHAHFDNLFSYPWILDKSPINPIPLS